MLADGARALGLRHVGGQRGEGGIAGQRSGRDAFVG